VGGDPVRFRRERVFSAARAVGAPRLGLLQIRPRAPNPAAHLLRWTLTASAGEPERIPQGKLHWTAWSTTAGSICPPISQRPARDYASERLHVIGYVLAPAIPGFRRHPPQLRLLFRHRVDGAQLSLRVCDRRASARILPYRIGHCTGQVNLGRVGGNFNACLYRSSISGATYVFPPVQNAPVALPRLDGGIKSISTCCAAEALEHSMGGRLLGTPERALHSLDQRTTGPRPFTSATTAAGSTVRQHRPIETERPSAAVHIGFSDPGWPWQPAGFLLPARQPRLRLRRPNTEGIRDSPAERSLNPR